MLRGHLPNASKPGGLDQRAFRSLRQVDGSWQRIVVGREHVYFDEPVVQLQSTSGLDTGVGYSNETIRSRGCTAALLSPAQPRYGYWVDPAPANRPPCPV
jgi:hypothetical protein